MPKTARKAAAKQKTAMKISAKRPPGRGPAAKALGALPEWNLNDLYSGLGDPAIKRDLDRADADSIAFEEAYKGRLAAMAGSPQGGAALAEVVRRYEAIDDLMGRLGSYAGLVHAGNTVDPARTKFFGDVQERLTAASTHLLFFTLELNRIDEAVLTAKLAGPELKHYAPWLRDIRAFRPHQLSDELEKMLHEKSVAGRSAWTRLFEETMAGLRFPVKGADLTSAEALHLLSDRDGGVRKAAAKSLGEVLGKNARLFALVTNTLANFLSTWSPTRWWSPDQLECGILGPVRLDKNLV